MSASASFKRVALIGFGLIGGSIARAARLQGLAGEIVTTARSEKTRARVAELGIVDRVLATNDAHPEVLRRAIVLALAAEPEGLARAARIAKIGDRLLGHTSQDAWTLLTTAHAWLALGQPDEARRRFAQRRRDGRRRGLVEAPMRASLLIFWMAGPLVLAGCDQDSSSTGGGDSSSSGGATTSTSSASSSSSSASSTSAGGSTTSASASTSSAGTGSGGGGAGGAGPAGCGRPNVTGEEERTLLLGGSERHFRVHTGSGIDPAAPVNYELSQYPETVRLLDSSIVLFSQTHPIAPQPSSLCEAYAEALAKVWLRLDEVLAATSEASVPAGD